MDPSIENHYRSLKHFNEFMLSHLRYLEPIRERKPEDWEMVAFAFVVRGELAAAMTFHLSAATKRRTATKGLGGRSTRI